MLAERGRCHLESTPKMRVRYSTCDVQRCSRETLQVPPRTGVIAGARSANRHGKRVFCLPVGPCGIVPVGAANNAV